MNLTAPSPVLAEPAVLCNPDGSDNLIGLPCSASIMGNLFLMAVYGGLLAYGAERISTGSEKLLEVWGPGLVGGLLLPVLGALPDAMVIAISVLKATDPVKLQEDLNVGMGTLVGSNVVLLTIPWAMTVALGSVKIGKRGLAKFQAHHVRKRKRRIRREKRAKMLALGDGSGVDGGADAMGANYASSSSSSSSSSGNSSTSDSSDTSSSSSSSSSSESEDDVLTGESIKIQLGDRTQRRMQIRKRRRKRRRKLRKRGLGARSKAARRRERAESRAKAKAKERQEAGHLSSIDEVEDHHDADVESHHEDEDLDGLGPASQTGLEMTKLEASSIDSNSENKEGQKTDDNDGAVAHSSSSSSSTTAAAVSAAADAADAVQSSNLSASAEENTSTKGACKRCCSYEFWFTQGVSVYKDTPITAWFLVASLLPFFIVQGVAFSGDKETTRAGAIAALVVCLLFFALYSGYQIRNDKVQTWKQKQAKKKFDALRWVAMAKKVADNELNAKPKKQGADGTSGGIGGGDKGVGGGGGARGLGAVSVESTGDRTNAQASRGEGAHIAWARSKLGLGGLEEQLTAGFLKFRSQDSTSRALKETIKAQSLQRRSTRQGLRTSKSMWLSNQTKQLLSKNSIQPPRNLKPAKMISTIAEVVEESPGPVSTSSVSVDPDSRAESTSPLDRQSTLGILLGQESVADSVEDTAAAARAADLEEGAAGKKTENAGADAKETEMVGDGGDAVATSEADTKSDGGVPVGQNTKGVGRPMKHGSSAFSMKDATHRMSTEYRSDRQFERTKQRRASEGASASMSRALSNSARHRSSASSRSIIYGNSRRLAREDPHTHVADRSVRRMKKEGATKQSIATYAMITRQMKGRINEVREVNAKAREVVQTLGQLADGSALTSVRQAMFETWSAENERAIKQAIFTAWKVNYQQLGDGGEDGSGEAGAERAGKLDPGEKRKIMNGLIKEGFSIIFVGVVVIFLVADGLIAALTSLGALVGVSSFILSTAIVPIFSNMSELFASFNIAKKKQKKSISMLFSMLYGGVVMNNAVSLATFLLCLVARDLVWDFAPETISLLIVVIIMGAMGSCMKTYLNITMLLAVVCFPLAIALVPLLRLAFPETAA
jgi:Ca2+/Na+ antiporter